MKKINWVLGIIVFFLVFHYLIEIFALSSVAKIKVITDSNHEEPLKVYYSENIFKNVFSERKSITSNCSIEAGKCTHTVHLQNRIVRGLRIDPIKNNGEVGIYSIEILSFFGDSLFFDAERIANSFYSKNSEILKKANNLAILNAKSDDPQLILKDPVKFKNRLFSLALPFFLALLAMLVVTNLEFGQIPAIKDITTKKPSTAGNITSLDGLRGFAALLVIADHTGYEYFKGLGAIGVWIFFCLSGFLLSIPFVKNPSLINSSSYLQHYFLRRIKRILPMYYFVLTIVYLFRGNLDDFVRHIVFIQGDGIFWSIPQEMFFYMILPGVFILNYFVCRGNIKIMLITNLAFALILNHFVSIDWLYIYGNGRKLPLWLEVFMFGVLLSCFYHSPYAGILTNRPKQLHDLFGILMLIVVLLSSDGFLDLIFKKEIHYAWNTEIYVYVASLLLLFTISHSDSWLTRLMSTFPFRAVGIVGFSFYLLHVFVISGIKAVWGKEYYYSLDQIMLFVLGIALTYSCSVITYSLIERPFMHKN